MNDIDINQLDIKELQALRASVHELGYDYFPAILNKHGHTIWWEDRSCKEPSLALDLAIDKLNQAIDNKMNETKEINMKANDHEADA